MKGFASNTYGDAIAELYDEFWSRRVDYSLAAQLLAELAGKGRALELGCGTGLMAIPLAERGVSVEAVEISEAMVTQFRRKPGAQKVKLTVGDWLSMPGEASYSLVYSTFCSFPVFLLTQQAQVEGLAAAARLIKPGGHLLIEQKASPWVNQVVLHSASEERVILHACRYEPVSQVVDMTYIVQEPGGSRFLPARLRYCSPPELDLMAKMAGLSLAHRYGGWGKDPFTAKSADHISIYRKD